MLSLDLFNTVYERALNEGAVDDLEARHIHGLSTKMLDLMTRAKNAKPEMKAALMREYAKIKDERDSFFKIKNEMGYGGLTHEGEITRTATGLKHRSTDAYGGTKDEADPLAKLDKSGTNRAERALGVKFDREKKMGGSLDLDEAGIGQDIADKKEKIARATPPTKAGAVASTVKNAAKWLAGKGGPGKEGPTYEGQAQKKNSEKPLDQALQRLKVKARREYPRAHTDDEALALKILNKEQEDVARLSKENEREERMIARLDSLEQNLQQQLDHLKSSDTLDEHGGGIGPKQRWQDLMHEDRLSIGDPVVVTAPNEFEGKTGEISEFSPSGKFVVVNLYNHGQHAMHLSDVTYNEYADKEDDYIDESSMGELDAMRQDLELMSDPQFLNAYGISKAAFQQKYRTLLNPTPQQDVPVGEGWSNKMVAQRTGTAPTPYSVYIKGKEWKSFADDDHAENVANKLRAKFKAEGKDPSVITIAPTGYDKGIEEAQDSDVNFGHTVTRGGWIVYDPETKQIKKRFKTHTGGKSYAQAHGLGFASSEHYFDNVKQQAVAEDGERIDPILIRALNNMPDGLATHREVLDAAYDAYAMELGKMKMKSDYGVTNVYVPKLLSLYKDKHGLTFNEAETDYSKRRQRERDIDAGKPVAKQRQPKMTDYQKRRAQQKKDMELGEEKTRLDPKCWKGKKIGNPKTKMKGGVRVNNCVPAESVEEAANPVQQAAIAIAMKKAHKKPEHVDEHGGGVSNMPTYIAWRKKVNTEHGITNEEQDTTGVERAILNRIMVAHTDLLMKFGPEKVMQAAEEVAYDVGDVDEVGTSDVSAWVHQVKQILGAV